MSYSDYFSASLRKQKNSILYRCSCLRSRPLYALFFCEECVQFACDKCSKVAVDTYFCEQCLSSYTSNVVADYNRCPKCADCPRCFGNLSFSTGEKSEAYMHCEYCRWSSESIVLAAESSDAMFAKLAAEESKPSDNADISKLVEKYKSPQTKRDKVDDRDPDSIGSIKRQFNDPNSAPQVSMEAIGKLESSIGDKRGEFDALPKDSIQNEFDPLDIGVCTSADCREVTSLVHRFQYPEVQPLKFSDLRPRRKRIRAKHSYRCPKCEEGYLVKPVINSRHIYFEKRWAAVEYVPLTTISPIDKIVRDEEHKVVIYFANPRQSEIEVTLKADENEHKNEAVISMSCDPFKIAAYDPTSDQLGHLDDDSANEIYKDDPAVVAERRQNKCGVFVVFTPSRAAKEARFSIGVHVKYSPTDLHNFSEFQYNLDFNFGALSYY